MRLRHFAMATLLAAAVAGPGKAATIPYDEGEDLSNSAATPTDLGNAPLGVSTVSGTLRFGGFTVSVCGEFTRCSDIISDIGDVVDAFSFIVPPGLKLVSAKLTAQFSEPEFPDGVIEIESLDVPSLPVLLPLSWSSTSGLASGGPYLASTEYELVPTNGALTGTQNLALQLSPLITVCSVTVSLIGCPEDVILPSLDLSVLPTPSFVPTIFVRGGVDWTVTLTTVEVGAIPLPAGLPLLGAGIGLLALLRARRKSA